MYLILLLFVHCALAFGTEHVPVLIWGSMDDLERHVPQLPSLSQLSSDDFSDIVMKKVGRKSESKPVIAVFVEENLSIEDFSWQDADGHAPFPHLENLTNSAPQVDFFPSVHSPIKGLKRLGYRWQNYLMDQENEIDLPASGGVVVVVKLGDAKIEENRPDFLKRHDSIIHDIYDDLVSRNQDVIAVYTSRHSSRVEPDYEPLVRRVRNVVAASEDEPTLWNVSTILFYSYEVPVFTSNLSDPGSFMNLTGLLCSRDSRSISESLKCRFKSNTTFAIEFKFTTTVFNYWNLDVFYNTGPNSSLQLIPSTEVYAPLNFSYHCTPEVMFRNATIALILKRFQLQPYVVNSDRFDEAFDCVAFFTVPIWAGLMVTALLGFILVIGLAMIMDINTMDRFDDPKGKTVTINVSE